jgi:hypothetical protein
MFVVMPALVAGIHALTHSSEKKMWMAGPSPAMAVTRLSSVAPETFDEIPDLGSALKNAIQNQRHTQNISAKPRRME